MIPAVPNIAELAEAALLVLVEEAELPVPVDVPVAAPVVARVVVPPDPVVAGVVAEEPDTPEVAGAEPPELSGWPTQLELEPELIVKAAV
jgi:hypothetical protein